MFKKRFYGDGIPGVKPATLRGLLVVIEGSDGSGRSTQITALRDWLEHRGHSVIDVGLNRSVLVSPELSQAKSSNVLSPRTLSLFYATDFADQLENKIIPSLQAGSIVLADRYIYTPMARDIVRGAERDWVEAVYSIALVPDAVFYLSVSPRNLAERSFTKYQFLDYWEAGMDMHLSLDWFTCFIKYQRLLQQEFRRMSARYGFKILDGNRSAKAVTNELRRELEMLLETFQTSSKE